MKNTNTLMLSALTALLLSPVLAANGLDAAAIFSAAFALPLMLPSLLPRRRAAQSFNTCTA